MPLGVLTLKLVLQHLLSNVMCWFESNASLKVENQVLEFVDTYNYLGYFLDSEM